MSGIVCLNGLVTIRTALRLTLTSSSMTVVESIVTGHVRCLLSAFSLGVLDYMAPHVALTFFAL